MAPYALPDISASGGQPAIGAGAERTRLSHHRRRCNRPSPRRIASGQLVSLTLTGARCAAPSPRCTGSMPSAYRLRCRLDGVDVEPDAGLPDAGDRLLMTEYGYLFMRTLCKLVGASARRCRRGRSSRRCRSSCCSNCNLIRAWCLSSTRVIPAAAVIHNDEIRRLRAALPEDVMLLVDEAYAEFVDPDFHSPLFDLAESGNTVITRSFSKIYGLAGLRVGWGYFPLDVRDQLRKVQNPGSVSSLSQAAARAAMLDQASTAAGATTYSRTGSASSWRRRSGLGLGLRVVPSQTSFLLVDFETPQRADSAFNYLRQHGLVVSADGWLRLYPPACALPSAPRPQMQATAATLADWQQTGR